MTSTNKAIELEKHILAYSPQTPMVCPYCDATAYFDKGLWRCNPCNALAKVFQNSQKPIGTMANQELWNARKTTLQGFGSLMKYWLDQGLSKTQSRKKITQDISHILGIAPERFNIERFDVELCKATDKAVRELYKPCVPICPYCNSPSNYISAKRIYRCEPCDAQVGVHRHSNAPLGSLANAELRQARKKAHSYFDPIWGAKVKKESVSISKARKSAYKWLADKMGLAVDDCHIGEFDLDQCKEVLKHCGPYIQKAMSILHD